jgi:DNA replication protein DnaC
MTDLIRARVAEALKSLHLKTAKNVLMNICAKQASVNSRVCSFSILFSATNCRPDKNQASACGRNSHRFPALKSLDSFEFDEQPSLDRRLINGLQSLAFIERAENVVLLGPPGVGKTHIATASARRSRAPSGATRLLSRRSGFAGPNSYCSTRRNTRA